MDKYKKMGRDAAKWARSPEGQKAIREALERAMESTKLLQEKRKVTWDMLHRPFDI